MFDIRYYVFFNLFVMSCPHIHLMKRILSHFYSVFKYSVHRNEITEPLIESFFVRPSVHQALSSPLEVLDLN